MEHRLHGRIVERNRYQFIDVFTNAISLHVYSLLPMTTATDSGPCGPYSCRSIIAPFRSVGVRYGVCGERVVIAVVTGDV